MYDTEIIQKLEVLAQKLGVAADRVWDIYFKQQILEATFGILIVGFIVGVFIHELIVFIELNVFRRVETQNEDEEKKDDSQKTSIKINYIMFFAFTTLVAFVAVMFLLEKGWILALLNPEYYTMQKIIKDITMLKN